MIRSNTALWNEMQIEGKSKSTSGVNNINSGEIQHTAMRGL